MMRLQFLIWKSDSATTEPNEANLFKVGLPALTFTILFFFNLSLVAMPIDLKNKMECQTAVMAKSSSPQSSFEPEELSRPSIGNGTLNSNSLRQRLEKYFKGKKKSQEIEWDSESAKQILAGIEYLGTPLDLEIFDTYLAILESTSGRYQVRQGGFYIDRQMGQRPRSPYFREVHWDWNILSDYFFNCPSRMSFVKEEDLKYLQAVLRTARSSAKKTSLREVLSEANNNWHIDYLSAANPASAREFRDYIEGKTYSQLYNELQTMLKALKKEWPLPFKNEAFTSEIRVAMEAFSSANSSFDLFIFQKYLKLAVLLNVDELKAQSVIEIHQPVTGTGYFDSALHGGSVMALTDFLFQTSHDTASKSFLLEIYAEMNRSFQNLGIQLKNRKELFQELYVQSRLNILHERWSSSQTPEIYDNEMYLYTVTGEVNVRRPQPEGGYMFANPVYVEIRVAWDEAVGKLRAEEINRIPLVNSHGELLRINDIDPLKQMVESYFNILREQSVFAKVDLDTAEQQELSAPLVQSSVMRFTTPLGQQNLGMVRIFHGNDLQFNNPELKALLAKESKETYIERYFKHLNIDERNSGEPIYEIGRFFLDDKVLANSSDTVLGYIANFFANKNMRGASYMAAAEGPASLWNKKGIPFFRTPEQLPNNHGHAKEWILKSPIRQLVQSFAQPYRSLMFRKARPSSQH